MKEMDSKKDSESKNEQAQDSCKSIHPEKEFSPKYGYNKLPSEIENEIEQYLSKDNSLHTLPSDNNETNIASRPSQELMSKQSTENHFEASNWHNQNWKNDSRFYDRNSFLKEYRNYNKKIKSYKNTANYNSTTAHEMQLCRPKYNGKYSSLKERNLAYPGGIIPIQPRACLEKLLFRIKKDKAIFKYEYKADEDSFLASCLVDGKVFLSCEKELHIASEKCAEGAFVWLIGRIVNRNEEPKEMRIYGALNLIAELITGLSLYKTLSSWYELKGKIPLKFWKGSRVRGSETKMKLLGQKLKVKESDNINLQTNLETKEYSATEETDTNVETSNDKQDILSKNEQISNCMNCCNTEGLESQSEDVTVDGFVAKLNMKYMKRDLNIMSVAKQNKLLKDLHGKIKFKRQISGSIPDINYKVTATLNETSYTANGMTFRAAKQRCVLAILKSCNGIDKKFSPIFRLREILRGKLEWVISRSRYNSKREDSKFRYMARLRSEGSLEEKREINRRSTGYGPNVYIAKLNSSKKMLRTTYGIDEYPDTYQLT